MAEEAGFWLQIDGLGSRYQSPDGDSAIGACGY